jgi:hypothetical protein
MAFIKVSGEADQFMPYMTLYLRMIGTEIFRTIPESVDPQGLQNQWKRRLITRLADNIDTWRTGR